MKDESALVVAMGAATSTAVYSVSAREIIVGVGVWGRDGNIGVPAFYVATDSRSAT